MRRPVFAALALAIACGDSTGPSKDVTGRWIYSATNVAGSGLSCNINALMNLTQTGHTLTGSVSSGRITCLAVSTPAVNINLGNTVVAITNGHVDGNGIFFDIDTQDIHNFGVLSRDSFSGSVQMDLVWGISTFPLAGNFTAMRQ